jgi:hypothetical protein
MCVCTSVHLPGTVSSNGIGFVTTVNKACRLAPFYSARLLFLSFFLFFLLLFSHPLIFPCPPSSYSLSLSLPPFFSPLLLSLSLSLFLFLFLLFLLFTFLSFPLPFPCQFFYTYVHTHTNTYIISIAHTLWCPAPSKQSRGKNIVPKCPKIKCPSTCARVRRKESTETKRKRGKKGPERSRPRHAGNHKKARETQRTPPKHALHELFFFWAA